MLKTIVADEAALKAELEKIREKQARLISDRQDAEERHARIRAEAAADAAHALVDGLDIAAGELAKRRSVLATCTTTIENTEAALAILEGRKQAIEQRLSALIAPKTDAVLDFAQELRLSPLNAVREGLAALAGPLSELVATDILIADFIGSRFAFDNIRNADLFRAGVVVGNLVDRIPARFSPHELDPFAIREKAIAIARSWRADLTGEENEASGS